VLSIGVGGHNLNSAVGAVLPVGIYEVIAMGAESNVAAFLIHVQAGAANLAIFGVDLPVLGHTPVANGVPAGARPVRDGYSFHLEHLNTPPFDNPMAAYPPGSQPRAWGDFRQSPCLKADGSPPFKFIFFGRALRLLG